MVPSDSESASADEEESESEDEDEDMLKCRNCGKSYQEDDGDDCFFPNDMYT